MDTFTYLIDAPEDGYVEDTAWLRIDQAASATAAEVKFAQLYEDEIAPVDEDMTFQCDGRVCLRAEITKYDADTEDVDDGEKLLGAAAIEYAAEIHRDDELRFMPCDPDDDGAIEWWRLQMVKR